VHSVGYNKYIYHIARTYNETKKMNFSIGKLDLQFKKKLVKYYTWTIVLYGVENGHFGKKIRNTWKLTKRGTRR